MHSQATDPIHPVRLDLARLVRAALAAAVTACGRPTGRHRTWVPQRGQQSARHERGMSTAEYAVGTVAACGFAALLFKIVTSDQVRSMLTDIIERALHLTF